MAEGVSRLGIYVSVPFCRAKCSFCNFASGVSSQAAIEDYLERLHAEIATARITAERRGLNLPPRVDSIYLGGGTPSLLSPDQLTHLLDRLRSEFAVEQAAEITLEAAPGQIADDLLQAAVHAGVNRVSLGVQSFVDREAQAVGRSHTGASCLAEIDRLLTTGIANVGADLICGLPLQTPESFGQSLRMAAGSGVTHLSVYMLEVDDKSRLGREVLGGGARLHAPAVPTDDETVTMYGLACERLPQAGFEQYEISNFSKPGSRSAHNLKYWLRSPYLGFGLDAHSMLPAVEGGDHCLRWQNTCDLALYTEGAGTPEPERIDARAAFEEEVFLGLRLAGGLAGERLAPYPAEWRAALARMAEPLIGGGLMEREAGTLKLTGAGRLVSSEIFGELLCDESMPA